MPRLREVPRAEVGTDGLRAAMYDLLFGDRDPVVEPGTSTGTPGDWWTVFANSELVFEHAVGGFGVYRKASLDPILRELAQTRAGYVMESQFVYSQHCKAMRGLGESEDRIAAIAHWQVSDQFDELERAVLAYTDCLCLQAGRVPEPVFEVLRSSLSDEVILELTYIASLYLMHAVMARALRTEWDDVEDRMSEVMVEGASDDALRISADDAAAE